MSILDDKVNLFSTAEVQMFPVLKTLLKVVKTNAYLLYPKEI